MNAVTGKELAGYYRQIKRSVAASAKEKKAMLRGLQSDIEEYIAQYPDASMEDIRSRFGEPEDIAADYMPDVTPQDMKRFSRRKKIIVGLVFALAVLISLFTVIYYSMVTESPGYIKETGPFDESLPASMNIQHTEGVI